MTTAGHQGLRDEIADLERRLAAAKAQLPPDSPTVPSPISSNIADNANTFAPSAPPATHDDVPHTALHALLLVADSALPLGSFAFSSGLESYLAHHKPSPPSASQLPAFDVFLRLSLATLASTALPYVLAAYRRPQDIVTLDNDLDASTPCTVARRASIAQGRALLAVWDRSFKAHYSSSSSSSPPQHHDVPTPPHATALTALSTLTTALRTASPSTPPPNAHLAPLWGLVTLALGLPLRSAAYIFLFAHARTVVSAAVRASVMGPYHAQTVLAGAELRARIAGLVDEGWATPTEDAGQCVPVMDLWVGRHERLYSRIFNS